MGELRHGFVHTNEDEVPVAIDVRKGEVLDVDSVVLGRQYFRVRSNNESEWTTHGVIGVEVMEDDDDHLRVWLGPPLDDEAFE